MYRLIENPQEGELIQYLGVYATRWYEHMGEPAVAFVRNEYGLEEALNDLDSVQLIDNTHKEAELAKREIIAILQKLTGLLYPLSHK